MANTATITGRLWANEMMVRTTTRSACTKNGMRMARIVPSAWVKVLQASVTRPPSAFQVTRDSARNGK